MTYTPTKEELEELGFEVEMMWDFDDYRKEETPPQAWIEFGDFQLIFYPKIDDDIHSDTEAYWTISDCCHENYFELNNPSKDDIKTLIRILTPQQNENN